MVGDRQRLKLRPKICIIMSLFFCITLFGMVDYNKKAIGDTQNSQSLAATVTTDTGINLGYYVVTGVVPSSDLWVTFNRDSMKINNPDGIKLNRTTVGAATYAETVTVGIPVTGTDTVTKQAYTRFAIHPNSVLAGDCSYSLTIPANTFSDGAGVVYHGGVFNFTTAASNTSDMGIYSVLPGSLKRKYPAGTAFNIYGRNFTSDCKVSIINESKATVISESKVKTTFVNSNLLTATLLADGSADEAMKTVGKYGVSISSTGRSSGVTDFSNTAQVINLTELDKPQIIDLSLYRPYPIDQQTIENMYLNGTVVPCLRITLYGQYVGISSAADLSLITVKKVGGFEDNFVDVSKITNIANITDKNLRDYQYAQLYNQVTKQITIPLKPLDSGYEYEITIPKTIIFNETVTNDKDFKFNFKVMSVPSVSEVSLASTVEGYNSGTMIRIQGQNFYYGSVIELNKGGKLYYVYPDWSKLAASLDIYRNEMVGYLPQGTTLEPGNYRVSVINDVHHRSSELQTFSVIQKQQDNSNVSTNIGKISKDGNNVTLEPSSSYGVVNLQKELGKADTWQMKTTYGSSSYFRNSRFYADDFDLKITGLNNSTVYTDYQTLNLSLATGGKSSPEGKKLASKVLKVDLNNKATIKGHIVLRYEDNYYSSMGLYYWNTDANKWIKLNKQVVNKADRTIEADFDGSGQNGSIYFAIFK